VNVSSVVLLPVFAPVGGGLSVRCRPNGGRLTGAANVRHCRRPARPRAHAAASTAVSALRYTGFLCLRPPADHAADKNRAVDSRPPKKPSAGWRLAPVRVRFIESFHL